MKKICHTKSLLNINTNIIYFKIWSLSIDSISYRKRNFFMAGLCLNIIVLNPKYVRTTKDRLLTLSKLLTIVLFHHHHHFLHSNFSINQEFFFLLTTPLEVDCKMLLPNKFCNLNTEYNLTLNTLHASVLKTIE